MQELGGSGDKILLKYLAPLAQRSRLGLWASLQKLENSLAIGTQN